jgi:hypothetical protein
LTWCHPQRYVSVTLQLVGSSPALAEERVRDFEVLVPSVPQAHQAMWAFSGLAHGADALRRGHTNIATEAVVRAPADGYTLLLANARRTRSTPRSKTGVQFHPRHRASCGHHKLPSWSTHRFGSRPFPNSSPMPKPIRVSPWRRLSALVPPSRPRNSRISSSATSSSSRCGPSSARRSKNAARLKREIEFDRRRAAQIQSTNHRHNYG